MGRLTAARQREERQIGDAFAGTTFYHRLVGPLGEAVGVRDADDWRQRERRIQLRDRNIAEADALDLAFALQIEQWAERIFKGDARPGVIRPAQVGHGDCTQRQHAQVAPAAGACGVARAYTGSRLGGRGDGLGLSEFHVTMCGSRIVADFREVKHRLDPGNVLNPGKIVDPPKMDDRALFRYPPDYRVRELETVLDWSAYPGAGGCFQGAVEMCNNNGACRKLEGGMTCPT